MDTEQNSIERLSPQAIARLFEVLSDSLRAPLDLEHARALADGGGYDWAGRIAVREAFEAGADPWHVVKVIGALVCERAERDLATPAAQAALDMLGLAEQLRTYGIDPEDDQVRWRLLGMIAESGGSTHISDAAGVLDAALALMLNDDPSDTSVAQAILERTTSHLLRDVHLTYKHRSVFGAYARLAPEAVLQSLLEKLVAAPNRMLAELRNVG
jgi:hypothetical protein